MSILISILVGLWLLGSSLSGNCAPQLKSDEAVLLYPSWARLSAEGTHWELAIQGRVFEPERRALTLAAFRKSLDLADVTLTPESTAIFNQRARAFLADNERGKVVALRVRNHPVASRRSGADGGFTAGYRLPVSEASGARAVRVEADPGRGRPPASAEILLLAATGLSVITDIDDTIKISEVTNKQALLRNTFLRPFVPVPGMAAVYRAWETNLGAQFHYVSASPWQLYESLAEFRLVAGFPAGTFHLRPFRAQDRSFLSLFASPEDYKQEVIEPMLRQFPRRRFVLVGDSGEKDPEIYGRLARRFPDQIQRILIRDVTGEGPQSDRYRDAFEELPPGLWQVFHEPKEILNAVGNMSTAVGH